jgi:two-component sensor histidine kinase/ligand-binding sensor domain-containing protein
MSTKFDFIPDSLLVNSYCTIVCADVLSGLIMRYTANVLRKFLVLIVLVLSNLNAQSEDIKFTHVTSEDGLSLNVVTQVLQDRNGFMWFGTYYGLNRFDGYNFKIFLPERSNPKSISNHSIWSLCEDRQGYIWIATIDGLNRYDWRTEEFKVYRNNPKDPNSLSENNILSVYEDKSGTIWVGTLNGLNKYNRDKDNFTVFKKVSDKFNSDKLNTVTCIQEDYKGVLWLGTWNGISCIRKDGTLIKQMYTEQTYLSVLDSRKITSLFEDKDKNMWIGLNGLGLDKYEAATGKIIHYHSVASNSSSLSSNFVNNIYQDRLGNIWIGTKTGLNKFVASSNSFLRILNNPDKPQSIINNEILSITEDNTGIIWIGTNAGLSKFYQSRNVFHYYEKNSLAPAKSLISNRVSSVFVDSENKIWVSTFDGLDEIDVRQNKIKHYTTLPGNRNCLNDNYVRCVLRDRKGIVWIGTSYGGLNRYDPSTGKFSSYQYNVNNPTSLSNNGVVSLCEDHYGNIWIGTWFGLNRLDQKSGTFIKYYANSSNSKSLSHNSIWTIFEDSEGMIWVGTDGGGACRLNPKTNIFQRFVNDSSKTTGLSANIVHTITETSDGLVWFGTTNGLDCYNKKNNSFACYNILSGLPSQVINNMKEDENGNLWLGGNNGLTKFDRRKNVFINYSKRDGLKNLDFTQNTSAKSKNGILYFGTKTGITFFDPRTIKDEALNIPLVFTDLKIYNKSVAISDKNNSILRESIISTKKLFIPYADRDITFCFALLDYSDVKKNNFSYKLEGFDAEWNEVGARNNATYTNLPLGEYTLRVRATINNNRNSIREASIKVVIVPEFYQTIWFKGLLVLSMVLVTLFIFMQRTKRITRLNKVLENRVVERTKDLDNTIQILNKEITDRKKAEEAAKESLAEKDILLKEIHHRVKNNLQVISSLLYLQSTSIQDENTRSLFEDSQNRIKSMALIHEKLYQSKNIALINFEEYINSLVVHLANSLRRELVVHTKTYIDNINLSLDTAISCGLIVNELITNAYKYAFPHELVKQKSKDEECIVEIRMQKLGEKNYSLSVRDNGIGLPENFDIENTESLGLKIVLSTIHQLEGTFQIFNENGSEFRIFFTEHSKS